MKQKQPVPPVRRVAILQAAMEVFAERGYQGTTVEEIARRAGVAKGTPYLHFADKADLFYAVFEKWVTDAMAGSEQALASASNASERLLALGLSAVDYMDAHREWFPLRERFAAALSGCYAGYRSEAAAIICAGQAAGELRSDADADALAALLIGAIDGLFLQCWFDPALDARKLIRGFFDALLRGIAINAEENP
jgi:AcrR family transcriptional regulator